MDYNQSVISPPSEKVLGEKGETFCNGKEGRVGFRKADMITPVGEASIIIIILKLLFLLMWSLPFKKQDK